MTRYRCDACGDTRDFMTTAELHKLASLSAGCAEAGITPVEACAHGWESGCPMCAAAAITAARDEAAARGQVERVA